MSSIRDARHDLLDDLLALAAHDRIDIRTTREQVLDFQGRLVAADDGGDLVGQLGDELADRVEARPPDDTDAQQIDFLADEFAEHPRVLVGFFVAKVENRHLADQALHTRRNVLQAGRGKQPACVGLTPEKRIQC